MSAKVHFNLRIDRPQADGSVQILFHFSLNSQQRLRINTGKFVPLRKEYNHLTKEKILLVNANSRDSLYDWDKGKSRLGKNALYSEKINHYLLSLEKKANDIILKFELQNKPLTIEGFKSNFIKTTTHEYFYGYFINELFERRKNHLSEFTLKNYKSVVTKIEGFRPKLLLGDIDHKFLVDFEGYMKAPISSIPKGCGNNDVTTYKNLKILRTLILIAIKNGDFLEENYPFKTFKLKEVDAELTTRDFLEPEDLSVLEKMYAEYSGLEKPQEHYSVVDWNNRSQNGLLSPGEFKTLERFLFCCYTGLRFRDMANLKKSEHIFTKFVTNPNNQERTNRQYLELPMHKTKKLVVIPLIDKALLILDKHKETDLVFDRVSNQKLNEHLKKIQSKAKLDKYLTFHVARHSFATICFIYDIPERVGQKLLGHRNRKFTEIYTHLSQGRLFYEMDKFNKGINRLDLTDEEKLEKNNIIDLLPMLQNLSPEKLTQLTGLIKLLGS